MRRAVLTAVRTAVRLTAAFGLAVSALAVTAPVASAAEGATVEMLTECSGGYGSGSGWDEAGRTYLACGSTVQIYSATGVLDRTVALPFTAEDVAPSPDGSAIYVARWDESPARMELQADGSYTHNAAWVPQPYSLYGTTFTPKGHWLATDAAGNLYLADGAFTSNVTHTVLKYAPDGRLVTRFGEWADKTWSTGTFSWQLNGLSVSRDGSEVVTVESGNDRLQRWGRRSDGSYAVTSTFGSNEQNHADRQGDACNVGGWSGEFAAPHDTGFDGAGNFYVLNTTCAGVDKFSATGAFLQSFDLRRADGALPHGFAVASNGDVFVPQSQSVIRAARAVYPVPVARDVADTCDGQQAQRFTDTVGTTHHYSINCVAGWRITSGRTTMTYEPAASLTRGQTATFLVNTLQAAGQSVPQGRSLCSEADVHVPNLERLVAAGVIPAPAGGVCAPTAPITRQVMALWTRNALASVGVTAGGDTNWYADDDTSPQQDEINQITALGIVTGKGGALYGPTETLTRGQMATFLSRTLDALRA